VVRLPGKLGGVRFHLAAAVSAQDDQPGAALPSVIGKPGSDFT